MGVNIEESAMAVYYIDPVPKPRMTVSDKWKKRPCVERYWAYKDLLRTFDIQLPVPYKITFYLPMPKSWSKKKKDEHFGQPHLQKPDKDNLEKALLDGLLDEDSHVWSGWAEKRWAFAGSIEIEPIGGEE